MLQGFLRLIMGHPDKGGGASVPWPQLIGQASPDAVPGRAENDKQQTCRHTAISGKRKVGHDCDMFDTK